MDVDAMDVDVLDVDAIDGECLGLPQLAAISFAALLRAVYVLTKT